MRLHVLSDLHLEFGDLELANIEADAVVLAGDIHLGREGRKWIRKQFAGKPVIYVLGNHEFYRDAIPELTEVLIRETNGSDIHVLENAAVEIGGFTFLGCTLWTDFQLLPNPKLAMREADRVMSDFFLIDNSTEKRLLIAEDTAKFHASSIAWLKSELAKRDPARTIVVTHHAPSAKSIPPYHAGSLLNAAFASALDSFVASSRVPLWIHGHTHHNVDYSIGSTRILSNQRGYPDQIAPGFNPAMVLNL